MAITAEQLYRSLVDLAGETINELYEHKCDNADDYNNQLQEIVEQHNQIAG